MDLIFPVREISFIGLLISEMNMEDIDPSELQPFPTLHSCLELIHPDLGFNIELKYPQTYLVIGVYFHWFKE